MIVESIVETVIAGAESAWRMRCDLPAAGIAETLLREIKRTRVASIVEDTAAQIMSRLDTEIDA